MDVTVRLPVHAGADSSPDDAICSPDIVNAASIMLRAPVSGARR